MGKTVKVLLALLSFPALVLAQNNLLDTSTWTVGSGSVPGFNDYGPASSNTRDLDTGPYGTLELIWKSTASNSTDNDGGWDADYVTVDPSKTYRLTVWIRRIGSLDGRSNFGFKALDANDNAATLELDGTVSSNPYFKSDPPPTLDDWYLLVAFVYGHGYAGGGNDLQGIYDTSGTRVYTGYSSFKFASNATKLRHRVYQRLAEPPTAQWFYGPTVYEVNGQEPTIQELVNGPNNNADTQAPTAPTLSSTGHTDTTANLSWSGATDNIGVTGYRIFKDGVLEATLGNVTTHQVTGLSASTAYSFTVTALDAAGNESLSSNAISVTTDATSGGGSGSSVWSETGSTASYNGSVAIGTAAVPSGYQLAVEGHVRAREVRVDQDTWPDYVFKEGYDLPSLEEIQKHIKEKGHLPNIPSANDVSTNGVELGEMDRLLLEKIEELTLYVIDLKDENDLLRERVLKLEKNRR